MRYHALSLVAMVYHALPCFITRYHGLSHGTIFYHALPCFITRIIVPFLYHPRNLIKVYDIFSSPIFTSTPETSHQNTAFVVIIHSNKLTMTFPLCH